MWNEIQGLSSTCPVFKYFQGLEFRRKKFKYFQGCVGTPLHVTFGINDRRVILIQYPSWSTKCFGEAIELLMWWPGVVASALASINEVNQRRARLVLRWVTVSGFNSRCGTFISVCGQPPKSTQPSDPFVGKCNEYQPKGGDALRLGSKGCMARVWMAGKTV